MNFLLKIVEGPMKGAEIALVSGTRLKVGRGADCDIVLADASLDEFAFELDVAEDGVTLVRSTGEMVTMRPFEVQDFGTTAVAVGPAEGAWQPLVRPQPAAEEETPAATPEAAPAAAEPSVEVSEAEPAAESVSRPHRRRCFGGCLVVLLLLLLMLGAAAWWLLGRDGEWKRNSQRMWEQAKTKSGELMERMGKKPSETKVSPETVKAAQARAAADLLELASKNGLILEETNGVRRLKGNLKRRTERMALRALALAADQNVKLELTDDESLCNAANETLLACSDGAISAVAVSNRVLSLKGFAPSPQALEKVLRALNEDVKGLERLDTASIKVGGEVPVAVAETPFVNQSSSPASSIPVQLHRMAANTSAKNVRDYPISGILMVPFPCVIMRDGSKLLEGAQIGSATLKQIAADRLTLVDGGREVEWRP